MKKDFIKIVRPHIPASVNGTEQWLQNKASDGLRLIQYNHWIFTFQKCRPYHGRYFIYSGFDKSKGFSYDYFRAKKKYQKAKSKLNQTPTTVFEVDINKIDSDYYGYIRTRNKFYFLHYTRLFLFSSFCVIISLCLVLYEIHTWFLLLLCFVPFIYSLISLVVLKSSMNHISE